jgi:hypothetical protein
MDHAAAFGLDPEWEPECCHFLQYLRLNYYHDGRWDIAAALETAKWRVKTASCEQRRERQEQLDALEMIDKCMPPMLKIQTARTSQAGPSAAKYRRAHVQYRR